jgi:hypothetical protein
MIGSSSPGTSWEFLSQYHVQTSSEAHPASYPMGTRGSFRRGKAFGAWSWPFTSISCRVQRMRVELYLYSPNMPSWRGALLKYRDKFVFTFTILISYTEWNYRIQKHCKTPTHSWQLKHPSVSILMLKWKCQPLIKDELTSSIVLFGNSCIHDITYPRRSAIKIYNPWVIAFYGCGWRRRLPYMEGICEYIE